MYFVYFILFYFIFGGGLSLTLVFSLILWFFGNNIPLVDFALGLILLQLMDFRL